MCAPHTQTDSDRISREKWVVYYTIYIESGRDCLVIGIRGFHSVQLLLGGRTDGRTQSAKKLGAQLGLRSPWEESDFSPRTGRRTCVYFLRREAVFSPPWVWIIQILGLFIARRSVFVRLPALIIIACLPRAHCTSQPHSAAPESLSFSLAAHAYFSAWLWFFHFPPKDEHVERICLFRQALHIAIAL